MNATATPTPTKSWTDEHADAMSGAIDKLLDVIAVSVERNAVREMQVALVGDGDVASAKAKLQTLSHEDLVSLLSASYATASVDALVHVTGIARETGMSPTDAILVQTTLLNAIFHRVMNIGKPLDEDGFSIPDSAPTEPDATAPGDPTA